MAGLAADELNKMATSLSKVSVYDDEAIKSSEALLLTFTNIGKNVFPEAEQAILDMSSALGQDLQSSTIQLGKALNDPIAGITALSRVGVSFTKEQKDMIKVLVESGDTLGAQKLILAELNKEFGGQAAAAADTYTGKIKQLNNELGNLGEAVGSVAIGPLTNAIDNTNSSLTDLTKGLGIAEDNYVSITKQIKIFTDATVNANSTTKFFAKNAISEFDLIVRSVAATNPALKMLYDLYKLTSKGIEDTTSAAESLPPAIDNGREAFDNQKDAIESAEDALKDYKDMLEEVSRANQDAESFIQSYADSQKQYAEQHGDAIEKLREAQQKYFEELYEHGKGSEEVEKASESVREQQNEVQKLEAQWHETTQAMIYDMALAKVSVDGFTDAEFAAMQKVAVEKGIRTQEQADQAIKMMEEANAIAAGVAADEAVMREQSKQDAILSELEKQAELEKTGDIAVAGAEQSAQAQDIFTRAVDSATLSIIRQGEAAARTAASVASIKYSSPSSGSGSGSGSSGNSVMHSQDAGGTGIAGTPYMIGTGAQPEIFIPKTNGTFIPNADKKGMLGGTTYNVYITNPKPESSENSIRSALKNMNYMGMAA